MDPCSEGISHLPHSINVFKYVCPGFNGYMNLRIYILKRDISSQRTSLWWENNARRWRMLLLQQTVWGQKEGWSWFTQSPAQRVSCQAWDYHRELWKGYLRTNWQKKKISNFLLAVPHIDTVNKKRKSLWGKYYRTFYESKYKHLKILRERIKF